jgi:hypothetical protein
LIEQTARIYREVFKEFGESYVLEDHSLASDSDDFSHQSKLLAENWDAPIVITTNVKFFESLHHNRPSVCRKLHRIAKSVVLCDEVQALPTNNPLPPSIAQNVSRDEQLRGVNLIATTLGTLASLAADFGTTVVFATATQPGFQHFQAQVTEICSHDWSPTEIIPDIEKLFEASKRVHVEWRKGAQSWETVADEVCSEPGSLVIVNTRPDAAQLVNLIRQRRPDIPVHHLSTNMCVEHRQQVLNRVRKEGVEEGGFLVATQCVEAGVDLDFRRVFRAWAPLDSVAQAAGRCNRNGKRDLGRVVVFEPEAAKYPVGGYRQAVQAAKLTIASLGSIPAELHNPELYVRYFQRLYSAMGLEESVLEDRLKTGNFVDVAALYKLIPDAGVNVVVRVGNHLGEQSREENQRLLHRLEDEGLSKRLMAELRPFTVTTFLSSKSELPLIELRLKNGEVVPGWYLADSEQFYDPVLGLLSTAPNDYFTT